MCKTRLRNGVLAIAALTVAGAGCASLLGDFESSPAGGEGDDGGNPGTDGSQSTDGTVSPGDDGGADGSTDANGNDAPVEGGNDAGFLTCTFSTPNPVMIDSREGASFSLYQGAATVLARSDSDLYVLQPGVGGSYTLWWVRRNDPNSPIENQISSGVIDTGGQVYGFQRVTGGAGLVQNFQLIGPGGPSFNLNVFGDNQPPGDPADGSAGLTPKMPSGLGNVGFGFTESAPSTYAWSVTGQLSNQDGGLVYAGTSLPDGGMTSNFLGSTPFHGTKPLVSHEGVTTRVFLSSDPTQGSAVVLKVADGVNGKDGGAVARSLGIDGGLPSLMFNAPEDVAGGGVNIAMIDVNVTGSLTGSLRIGHVPTGQLDTFTAADLPVAIPNVSAQDLPVGGGPGTWAGDDLMLIGFNPLLTSGSLSLIWLDVQGHVRAKQTGANGLLTGHVVDHVSVALHQKIGTAVASWHVVWSEQKTPSDGGPAYDVLYYNELVCD